jgi:hypothetical protein
MKCRAAHRLLMALQGLEWGYICRNFKMKGEEGQHTPSADPSPHPLGAGMCPLSGCA